MRSITGCCQILILACLIFPSVLISDDYISVRSKSIDNIQEATNRADEYIRLSRMSTYPKEPKIEAEIITLKPNEDQFISQRVHGMRVWHVTYRDLYFITDSYPQVDTCSRDFHIFMDSTTGILYKLYAPYKGNDILRSPNKELTYYEDSLKAPYFAFTDFINDDSVLSFYGLMHNKALGDLQCNEFCAYLIGSINNSFIPRKCTPYWVILVWGRELFDPKNNEGDLKLLSRSFCERKLFNAKTGRIGRVELITGP